MKKFMAVYLGTPAAFEKFLKEFPDPQARKAREQAGMHAWFAWAEKHAKAIVDNGAPLGKTKRIGADGIRDTRNNMAGYTVVQAKSHEAAARLFENHPHFTLFPGDSVEVMECLPMPDR